MYTKNAAESHGFLLAYPFVCVLDHFCPCHFHKHNCSTSILTATNPVVTLVNDERPITMGGPGPVISTDPRSLSGLMMRGRQVIQPGAKKAPPWDY